jgi:rubredoxin
MTEKYGRKICGYTYDPAYGNTDAGISPGTAFAGTIHCQVCGSPKEKFTMM